MHYGEEEVAREKLQEWANIYSLGQKLSSTMQGISSLQRRTRASELPSLKYLMQGIHKSSSREIDGGHLRVQIL